MSREFKSLSFTNIKAQSDGRTIAGICAVFGNVDDWGDRIQPGAFAKAIAEGARRARHLWNHSYEHPPIASIKELRELNRAELPPEVLEKAPDATGGLLVKREYYDADLSNWVLQSIDKGDINEMSFAYEVVRSATITEPVPGDAEKTREIRELQELKLYDTSDVLWGMNMATVAAGAKNIQQLPLGVIASHLFMLKEQLQKAGRRNSNSDQKLIDMVHSACVELGAGNCPLNETNTTDDSDSDAGKAGAAADADTSLSPNWLELQKARAQVLVIRNSINN